MDSGYIHTEAKKMAQKIDILNLSQYAYDKLYWNGYRTLGKLSKLSVQDLLKIDGIGPVYCSEIVEKAAAVGITIQDDTVESPKRHLKSIKALPYPHNLLLEIFGDSHDAEVELSSDRIAGISYVLHQIDERAATMILLRYKHNATVNEISNYFSVSNARVQQIMDKAITKLRHPHWRTLMLQGLHAYMQQEITRQVEERVDARLKGEYLRGFMDGKNEAAKENPQANTGKPNSSNTMIPIEDMNLSVRTFNCLKRAGKNHLCDLIAYESTEDIFKIRNIGKRCMIEIAEKIQSYGFIGTIWDEFLP